MKRPPPERHLVLLRERLEADGEVEFKAGAKVRVERRYVVETPLGAIVRYTERELPRAYELASRPAEALRSVAPADPELDAAFGERAPW